MSNKQCKAWVWQKPSASVTPEPFNVCCPPFFALFIHLCGHLLQLASSTVCLYISCNQYVWLLPRLLYLLSPSCLPLSLSLNLKTIMKFKQDGKHLHSPPPPSISSLSFPHLVPLFSASSSASSHLSLSPYAPLTSSIAPSFFFFLFFYNEIHHLGKREWEKKTQKTKQKVCSTCSHKMAAVMSAKSHFESAGDI